MSSRWITAARSSGLWRFLGAGVDDLVDRAGRLTAHEAPDEADVLRAVEESGAVAAIERVLAAAEAATRTSVLVRAATARWDGWLGLPLPIRSRAIGVALLSAAAVHVALTSWQGTTAGWLWLVIPTMTAAVGALLTFAPSRGLADHAPQ